MGVEELNQELVQLRQTIENQQQTMTKMERDWVSESQMHTMLWETPNIERTTKNIVIVSIQVHSGIGASFWWPDIYLFIY